MSQRTPGPWHVEDRRLTHPQSGAKSGGGGLLIIASSEGGGTSFCVASVNPWGGGNEADAHLLAAAPELLDALWEISQRVARQGGDTAQADRALAKILYPHPEKPA